MATYPRVPPRTGLGKALAYLHNHWDGLTRFLDDGRLEIDNNAAENAIRPFVIGRRYESLVIMQGCGSAAAPGGGHHREDGRQWLPLNLA